MHVDTNDHRFEHELNLTLSRLEQLVDARAASAQGPIASILYRGTQAAIPHCSSLRDPLPEPWHAPPQWSHPYHWERLELHNQIAKRLLARRPMPFAYMDTFQATSMRPGGHRREDDCVHSCLPSPMDKWTRLILAAWTGPD